MKIFLFTFFNLIGLCAVAQFQASTNDVVLVKEVPVKKYRGGDYQITAEIKSVVPHADGSAAFTSLQVGKTDWDFMEKTRKAAKGLKNNSDWQQVAISGKIDSGATKLWLYLLTYGNGDFYFDNLRFKIKNKKGLWENVKIANGDFEASTSKKPLIGFRNTKSIFKKKDVQVNLANDSAHKRILHLQSRNAQPDERIFYGYNKKAGNYINANGIKLYYETYGTGEPLLLLHGNGGSIISFSRQIADFSKKYKVIAVDTRGQGHSRDSVSLSFSYLQFADDLKVLLDSLHLKKINLLGWSDGANTALLLASKHPEYVGKLITVGANLNPSTDAVNKKTLATVRRDIEKMKARKKETDKVTIRLLEMLLKEPNIDPQSLSLITAKTLVMAGENDIILEKHTRLIANRIHGAELVIVKGQNHYLIQENPALFNLQVLGFLEK